MRTKVSRRRSEPVIRRRRKGGGDGFTNLSVLPARERRKLAADIAALFKKQPVREGGGRWKKFPLPLLAVVVLSALSALIWQELREPRVSKSEANKPETATLTTESSTLEKKRPKASRRVATDEEIQEALRTVLRNSTIAGAGAVAPEEKLGLLYRIVHAHFTGRAAANESPASLRGLLRHLAHHEALPQKLVFTLAESEITLANLKSALGPPESITTGSRLRREQEHSIYGDATEPLLSYRPSSGAESSGAADREESLPVSTVIFYFRDPGEAAVEDGFNTAPVIWHEWRFAAFAFPSGAEEDAATVHAVRIFPEQFPQLETAARGAESSPDKMPEARVIELGDRIWALAVAPGGEQLAAGQGDSGLSIIDFKEGAEIRKLKGHEKEVLAVDFSPEGGQLFSGGNDNFVRLWDVKKGRELFSAEAHTEEVTAVSFSPDGKYALSGGADGILILWDLEKRTEIRWLLGHTAGVTSVEFSPDGKRAVSAGNDYTVRLWDIESGKENLVIRGHETGVQDVDFSPDGKRVLSCSGGPLYDVAGDPFPSVDHTIRIWSAETGEELQRMPGHRNWVLAAAFSPDGRRILSGSGGAVIDGEAKLPADENEVRLWDATSGREIARFAGHENIVRTVAFTPDGGHGISASWDGTIRVWKLPEEQQEK